MALFLGERFMLPCSLVGGMRESRCFCPPLAGAFSTCQRSSPSLARLLAELPGIAVRVRPGAPSRLLIFRVVPSAAGCVMHCGRQVAMITSLQTCARCGVLSARVAACVKASRIRARRGPPPPHTAQRPLATFSAGLYSALRRGRSVAIGRFFSGASRSCTSRRALLSKVRCCHATSGPLSGTDQRSRQ